MSLIVQEIKETENKIKIKSKKIDKKKKIKHIYKGLSVLWQVDANRSWETMECFTRVQQELSNTSSKLHTKKFRRDIISVKNLKKR